MGIYLNPGKQEFDSVVNHSKIYIDKTDILAITNSLLFGEQKYICISRPRRFGKSMTAKMLTAYYGCGYDAHGLFDNLKIAQHNSYEQHINKYNVIRINMQDELSDADSITSMIKNLKKKILWELREEFGTIRCYDWNDFTLVMKTIYNKTEQQFIIIIDEWDCIFRTKQSDENAHREYLDFLCLWLKDKPYIALAYMTGILPIKKYGGHSALNMFYEYSMTEMSQFSEFTGFTEKEVESLCEQYQMDFPEMKKWYDGYCVDGISIYNPKSVVESILRNSFSNYWTSTETYEALKVYIAMNYDGLRDAVVKLLAGESVVVDTTTFSNDMVTFASMDDVLTLLIHLGYLSYDRKSKTVFIPNYEVSEQFMSTVRVIGWSEVADALKISEELLRATLDMQEEKVAELISIAHRNNTSIIKYNDENALSCVLSIAYYTARRFYMVHRELPSGNGYSDLVFAPRQNSSIPALIIELKWNHSAETAIQQIKQKGYLECLGDYKGEVLLVGINYDKKSKMHSCKIEKIVQ